MPKYKFLTTTEVYSWQEVSADNEEDAWAKVLPFYQAFRAEDGVEFEASTRDVELEGIKPDDE
jgi:hypothetical protein